MKPKTLRRAAPLLLLAVATASQAQTTSTVLDSVFRQWRSTAGPGCTVGVDSAGVRTTRAYGMANLEYGVALRPESVIESGSVAKQFTAAELLTGMVKDLTAQVIALATKAAASPPPAADPLAVVTSMLTAFKALQPAPPPENPLLAKLAEISLLRIAQEPKTKTLAETLADLRAVKSFMGGESEGAGPTMAEVGMALIENIDKVGSMLASLQGPPVLPPRPPPAAQQTLPPASPNAPQPAQKSATPPLPDGAKAGFVQLRDLAADKEQEIGTSCRRAWPPRSFRRGR